MENRRRGARPAVVFFVVAAAWGTGTAGFAQQAPLRTYVSADNAALEKEIERLRAEDVTVRKDALLKLGLYSSDAALKAIEGALKDQDPEVRSIAARILAEKQDKDAVEPLKRYMEREKNPQLLENATRCVEELEGR